MEVSDTPSVLKQFHRTPWKFQRTFKTPLKNLQPFVATIVSAGQSFKTARPADHFGGSSPWRKHRKTTVEQFQFGFSQFQFGFSILLQNLI
jgi:hypothetical protein